MGITNQFDAQEHEAIRRARLRGLRPSMLAAAALAIGAIAATLTAARAEAPRKDLWQTYMEAAAASDQSDNFDVEAIILNAALAHAKKFDPDGARPALARLPLMLVYDELGKKDLVASVYDDLGKKGLVTVLAEKGMRIDDANPDRRYDDYIKTIDSYASTYFDRWGLHENDEHYDDFKQEVRFYGLQNSYLVEVALRAKLRPDDKVMFAQTMSYVALVYRRGGNLYCAAYDFGRSYEMFRDFRPLRAVMAWAGGRFSVGDSNDATAQQNMNQIGLDTQMYTELIMGMNIADLAKKTLNAQPGDQSDAQQDLSACDASGPPARTPGPDGFDAQVSRAVEYYAAVFELARDMHQHWPGHPLFGVLDSRLAELYKLEFEMSQKNSGQYPGSLDKSKDAFERSLDNLVHAQGLESYSVQRVATEYDELLHEAKLNDEAQKVENHYKVKPSDTQN